LKRSIQSFGRRTMATFGVTPSAGINPTLLAIGVGAGVGILAVSAVQAATKSTSVEAG
jgi:hypothetical protein